MSLTKGQKYYSRVKADPIRWQALRATRHAWYVRNKQHVLEYTRGLHRKQKLQWDGSQHVTPEIRRKAEDITGRILSKYGFTDVRQMSWQFPVDYLARKDGTVYFVEVTTARLKQLRKPLSSRKRRFETNWRFDYDRVGLATYLGAKIAVVFLRPPELRDYFILVDPQFRGKKTRVVYFHHAQIKGTTEQL